RQGKPRHAQRKASKANASQGNACQGHAQRKARQAKGNASQGNACQGQAKAMPQAKANARQGKPNAWQGKHVKIQSGKTNLSHDGLNPAHVPYWWVNNPTLGEFCFTMIGRADIEGSKSNVAMNAWLPQAGYPRGNFSDTSSFKFRRSKGSIGHAFTVRIRLGNQNQTSFYPFVPHEISVLVELILGHLRYLLTDVPPQPNSPPTIRIPLVRTGSEAAVRRPGKVPEGTLPVRPPGRHAATRSRRGSSSSNLHRRPLRRARAPGFAATAAPSYSSGPGTCPDGRVSAQLGTVTRLPVHPASPVPLTKNGPLGALDSMARLNKAAAPSYLFKV
ncbi:unnamed protein product, partial [Prunus brigantina]